jgi:IS605 OrfB family transposase
VTYPGTHRKYSPSVIVQQTARLRLILGSREGDALAATVRQYALAFNVVTEAGWTAKRPSGTRLHKETYHPLRAALDLPSQLVISARMKAVEALASARALEKKGRRVSRPRTQNPSVRFDARSYRLDWATLKARLTMIGGRFEVAVRLDRHSEQFRGLKTASAELVRRPQGWFLHVTVSREVEDPVSKGSPVGVDRGIRRPAVSSLGRYFGKSVWRAIEERTLSLRSRLQAKGTRSARRHLRRLQDRLARFRLDCDHKLSYQLVRSCEPGDTIVFEDLTHLRERVKVRGPSQRRRLHSWSFARLGDLVGYKAALRGIQVQSVDPRGTSRRCPQCEHREAANRKSQSRFHCVRCGFERNADLVGSWNIRDRYRGLWAPEPGVPGPVTGPNVTVAFRHSCKPRALARGS